MHNFKGMVSGVKFPIIGRVSFTPLNFQKRRHNILILKEKLDNSIKKGYAGVITTLPIDHSRVPNDIPCIFSVDLKDIEALNIDDILLIQPSGHVRRLWDINSIHNSLMITNSCNCNCLMCPQPPTNDPSGTLEFNIEILNLLKKDKVKSIGLTGGEPTTKIHELTRILKFLKQHFPNSHTTLLSNGRAFHDMTVVKTISEIGYQNLLIGVSLQADVEKIHDEIVGVKGCFSQTVRGLHNLALARQSVEIRVVIMKKNYKRLPQLAEFIYRNFPFAKHIAFMGLEVIGMAVDNYNEIWIEPGLYSPFLEEAIWHLHQRYLDVSIYNLPYCLLSKRMWGFARNSISEWKKSYLDLCLRCSVKKGCPGIFATSIRQSQSISPI
jgi:His-Xaa-Ser system radical SAM maturase HxsC